MNFDETMKKIKSLMGKQKKEGKEIYFFFKSSDFTTEEWENRKQIIKKCNEKGWFGDIFVEGFNLSYQPERIEKCVI